MRDVGWEIADVCTGGSWHGCLVSVSVCVSTWQDMPHGMCACTPLLLPPLPPVCGRAARAHSVTFVLIQNIYIYIYIYIYVYITLCVYIYIYIYITLCV